MGCFVVAEFLLTSASRGPSAIAEPLVKITLWPWNSTFDLIFLAQLLAAMDYISTNFGVNSSSRLPFRARTHRHKSTNATDHYIPRLVYRRRAGINSWHVAVVMKFIHFSILVCQPAVCTSRRRSAIEISSTRCVLSLPCCYLHRRYRPTNHSAAFSIYRPTNSDKVCAG